MHFVYPAFLFSLFVLAIPVIIHLFYFRRFKQVLFSNIRFLKLIRNEKQSKNNLKQLILLILRLLALAFLIFAFAQPYLPVKDNRIKSGKKAISIYIDNSMSMENIGSTGTMLDNAKKIAAEIVKAYDINDEYQVITNDLAAKHQRFYEQGNIQSLISEIGISPFSKKLSTVLQRQISNINESKANNRIIYVLSDMQKTSADLANLNKDSSVVKYFIPISAPASNNIAIDSAWIDKPILRLNQQVNLKVNITNYGDKAVEDATITLQMNGVQKGLANYNLAPNQTITITIPFTISQPGWNKLVLNITDYPFTFDDDYYMSFYIRDKINILCLNNDVKTNPFIRSVFSTDEYFSYNQELISMFNNIDMNKYQFLILNEITGIDAGMITKLINYVSDGGNLLLIPTSQNKSLPDTYNPLLSNFSFAGFDRIENLEMKVSNMNIENSLLRDIFTKVPQNADLPKVRKFYSRLVNQFSTETSLLKLDNNQSLLAYVPYNRGNVFVLSVPLNDEWSNFPRHAIFLPVMYQLALQYINKIPLSFDLVPNKSIELNDVQTNSKVVYTLKSDNKSFIPDQKIINGHLTLFTNEDFSKSGFYTLTNSLNPDRDDPVLAFNYQRNESNTACFSTQELKKLSDQKSFNLIKSKNNNSKVIIERIKSGRPLWKVFIIFVLIFLTSEILVIRFWKV
jgi:hypothetical protein